MEKGMEALDGLVWWVRGERVILDKDLARLDGVGRGKGPLTAKMGVPSFYP